MIIDAAVIVLQELLDLRHWNVRIDLEPLKGNSDDEGEEYWATIKANRYANLAIIHLGKDFWKREEMEPHVPYAIHHTLIHELLHLHTIKAWQSLQLDAMELLNSKAMGVVVDSILREMEIGIDTQAAILVDAFARLGVLPAIHPPVT